MFQRIQTIWLLLASAFSFLSLRFPVYSGTKIVNGVTQSETLDSASDFFLLVLTVAVGLIALITIFLFKNRKLQFRLCIVGLLIQIGCLILYYVRASTFNSGVIALWALFPIVVPIFFILAARGIYKDEKLVKSVDRLR